MSVKSIITFLIVILVNYGCINKLNKAKYTIEKRGSDIVILYSFYRSLSDRFELVLSITGKNSASPNLRTKHLLIGFNNKNCVGYVITEFSIKSLKNESKSKQIDSVLIDRRLSKEILSVFKKTDNWILDYNDTHEDSADDYCFYKTPYQQCIILHGITYGLAFYTKNKYTASFLYAPERFETECCSGNINRQKFIKINNLVTTALMPISDK